MNRKNYIKRKNRRTNLYLKRNFIIFAISVICILAATLFINSFSTKANANDCIISYKYYKSIEIQKGDTLWSIADLYMDDEHYKNKIEYIREVKEINSLGSDRIVSGKHIIVPYYSYEYL